MDACQPTSVVQLDQGCSAVLIHPRVLLYPAHCRGPIEHANAGDVQLPIERCQSYPDGSLFGSDLGFCVLHESARDLALIAPALGCEVDAVAKGASAWLVGFGATPSQPAGHRHVSQGVVQGVDDEIAVAGPGFGACAGDSGGPLLIEVDDGSSRALRVAGILSASSQEACGESTAYFTPVWPFLSWLESESGFDLTACGQADGAWNPGPECLSYSRALLESASCHDAGHAQMPFVSTTCGAAAESDVHDGPLSAASSQSSPSCSSVLGRSRTPLPALLVIVLLGLTRALSLRRTRLARFLHRFLQSRP